MEEKEDRMGFITTLMNSNIRFNPRPWDSNDESTATKMVPVSSKGSVDMHLSVSKQVDKLIAQLEKNDGSWGPVLPTGKSTRMSHNKIIKSIEKI